MSEVILNSKGQPVTLTAQEQYHANVLQRKFNSELRNSVGYDINMTSLTTIAKRVTEQKFFEIKVSDYVPVLVGNGAWSDQIITYRDFQLSGDFEQGIINTGAANSRLAESDAAVDALVNPVINWAKTISYSLFDLKMAAKSGNWDLVTSKEKSRKRNWDLGIQKIAFLGATGSSTTYPVYGLLNQPAVTANTTFITAYINSLSASNFSTFVAGLIDLYRVNANRTTYPTHFIIPESDYNGLATLVPGTVGTYPIPMLDYLLNAFKLITMNPNFKILPCAYADKTQNNTLTGLNKNVYTLLNYDEDTIRMDIPVDYSNTLQNTINGFQFQSAGYGQFTGVLAYRPLELLYFTF